MNFFSTMRNFLYNAEPALAQQDKALLREARNLAYENNQLEREHAALVAVAEVAANFTIPAVEKMNQSETRRLQAQLSEALVTLAAVRAGQPRNTEPSAIEIELVAVEFGFKCCEKGMNLDATFEKLKQMKRDGNGGVK